MLEKLTTTDHDRNAAGLKYVYPVISRRAGGLSIGINFNTNNACNWRCIYCQVPGLIRGSAPELDEDLLERELTFFLHDVMQGDFYDRFAVEEDKRVIRDIAISGNGEPTSLKKFARAVALIGDTVAKAKIPEKHKFVLITNGSLVHQQNVQQGLKQLSNNQGEVWFKVDSATETGRKSINNAVNTRNHFFDNLITAAELCPTWLQTCLFSFNGKGFPIREQRAYLQLLRDVQEKAKLEGVLLYTLARPSLQPEAEGLVRLSEVAMNSFAEEIRQLGLVVKVSV